VCPSSSPLSPTLHTPPQEKSDVQPELPPRLSEGWGALQGLAVELAELQGAAGLPLTPEDYCREVLHPGLMQVCGWGGVWFCFWGEDIGDSGGIVMGQGLWGARGVGDGGWGWGEARHLLLDGIPRSTA
jgi:hypothetical protein